MKEQILELRKEGKTYDEIRAITGASKGTIAYHLGDGQKDKYRASNQRKRAKIRAYVEDIKSKLECEQCKEKRWWVLDFHHVDPTSKEASVAALMTKGGKERIIKEISKCKVLCSNCHRDLHYKERNAPMVE